VKRRTCRTNRGLRSRCVFAEALETRRLLTTIYVDAHATSANDAVGNPIPALGLDFFVLAGDATQNRVVDTADFTLLAANFNKSSVGFSKGDFNYDGTVNALDFNILASQFGKSIAPPPPAPVVSASSQVAAVLAVPDLFGEKSIDPNPSFRRSL